MKQRNIALDVIRCFALFCVISVHFFLNSGFYDETIEGINYYIMVVMRSFFMICVPLFMILTGYLKNKAEISKKYYIGIIKIIVIYIIASILCLLFKTFYQHEKITFALAINKVLNFSAAPYAWYIEMYIGLFLLIPFLNLVFNNLRSKKQAKVLIITMLILTALPAVFNIYRFASLKWWLQPSSQSGYQQIMPAWWEKIYPITYYFIGAYISKFGIKMSAKKNVILLILSILIVGTFNFYRSYGSTFIKGKWSEYGSILNVILATLTFLLLLRIKPKKEHKYLSKMLKAMSNATLCAYLSSWIFDKIFYQLLKSNVAIMSDRICYYPLIAISIFILSILVGIFVNIVYNFFYKNINSIITKMKLKRSEVK